MEIKKIPNKKIGEILIEEGFLDSGDLEKGLAIQKKEGGLIGNILLRMGVISEEQLVIALSKQLIIPFIHLSSFSVNREALKLIPKEIAEKHLFFPFDQSGPVTSIAMSDPLHPEAFEAIEKRVPGRIQIFLATPSEIKEAIGIYYNEGVVAPLGRKQ